MTTENTNFLQPAKHEQARAGPPPPGHAVSCLGSIALAGMAAPSQLSADEAATRVAEGAANNADGDDDRVIEALFEELGLDARQEVAQNMDHGSSLDDFLQDLQTDNVASDNPIIESNHENDDVDIVVEDDGNKDVNEDDIDDVEEEDDDENNDEEFERQMNKILAIGDNSLSTELSEPSCFRLQTPKPINLYFRIADEKYAAIRVDGRSSNRALAGLRACIEEHCLPQNVAISLERALWAKLSALSPLEIRSSPFSLSSSSSSSSSPPPPPPLLSSSSEDRQALEIKESEWMDYYASLANEREQQSRHRASGSLPWFKDDCSEAVFVFRRAAKLALENNAIALEMCTFEAECSAKFQDFYQEKVLALDKLKTVQQHELRFMQDSLGGDHGISKADIEKLRDSHQQTLSRFEAEQRRQEEESLSDWLQTYRRLVLSRVGNLRDDQQDPTFATKEADSSSSIKDHLHDAYEPRDANSPDVLRAAHHLGLGALRPEAPQSHSSGAHRGKVAKLASASQGVFGATLGNLTMGAWVGQLVPTELLSSDLRLEASASGARVRERLDKMVSTDVNVVDVYLGAQLKVLLHVRVETVIGGALWALSHASPCVSDTEDFANWRQSRLLRLFSSRKSSGEPISFVAIALPGAQAARIDAALHQTVDLFRPYLDQNHEKQSKQSQRTGMSDGKVLSTLHSNLGLDVVCVMRSFPKDRDPALRAVIEDAAARGVTNLCIPLRDWILEEEALRTEDSEATNGKFTRTRLGKAEVEQLVRVVRASLLSLAHRNIMGKLREVTFLLKSSCADASLARGDAEISARKVLCEQDGLIVSKAMTLIKATFDAT